jgi:HEAT repeat protein
MRRWMSGAVAAFLMISTPAAAASTTKMTEDQLITQLQTHKSSKQREKAADELGERRAVSAVRALREACAPSGEPFVCEHAIWALEKYRSPEANAAMKEIILDAAAPKHFRMVAARSLGRVDDVELAQVAPQALARYRSLETDMVKLLVTALAEGGNAAAQDFTVLIARDTSIDRPARVAALEAAQTFNHPRLYEAWLALVKDDDKALQIRCAEALGRSGLPPMEVVPVLMDVAKNDEQGDVRGAAMKALRSYASPTLLPLLNHAVLNERHLGALMHAVSMFPFLADSSSIPALQQVFVNYTFADGTMIDLIHAAIRIGDPVLVPALQTLAGRAESEVVRAEATNAALLLQGPVQQRTVVIAGWPMLDVQLIDMSVVVPPPPALSLTVDATGAVMVAPGFEASVSIPGVQVQVTAP